MIRRDSQRKKEEERSRDLEFVIDNASSFDCCVSSLPVLFVGCHRYHPSETLYLDKTCFNNVSASLGNADQEEREMKKENLRKRHCFEQHRMDSRPWIVFPQWHGHEIA